MPTTSRSTALETKAAAPPVMPMLAVPDVGAATEFYKTLGFAVVQEIRDGTTLVRSILQLAGTTIHVAAARALPEEGDHGKAIERGPRGLGVVLYVPVADIEDAHRCVQRSGARIVQPLQDAPWGDRFVSFVDPFGFDWCFARLGPAMPQGVAR